METDAWEGGGGDIRPQNLIKIQSKYRRCHGLYNDCILLPSKTGPASEITIDQSLQALILKATAHLFTERHVFTSFPRLR